MTEETRTRRAGLAVACAVTIAAAAVWSWPLAQHLSTHTLVVSAPVPSDAAARASQASWNLILANDQDLSLWGAAANARALLRGDWRGLLWQQQCYPMPEAGTLGEHMIETGVLAAPWSLVSGDPVVGYNLSLLAALVIAAAGMFLFLQRHTASVPAAVAGAFLFAFTVPRLVDLPYHPAVVGTHWIPWVLWAFDGLLAGGSIGAWLAFAVALLLSCVVGSYPLMAVGMLGAAYGAVSIVQRWRRGTCNGRAIAWCVAGALPACAVVASVVFAYARVQQQWVLVPNPDAKFLVGAADYLPGGVLPAGLAALVGLPLLVLLRRRNESTAVPALVAATVLAFLLTTRLPLPGGATWSAYETLARSVALLDSVRAPGKAGLAVVFGLQALGAIGWGRAMNRLGTRASVVLAAGLVALTWVEVRPPSWTGGRMGSGAAMQLRAVAPPPERIDVLRSEVGDPRDRRAVLDLPVGRMVKAPVALLDAAYHGHATSACYNSLIPPTMRAVYAMAARSHTEQGIAELAAAGFGFVIERPASSSVALSSSSFPAPARLLAFDGGIAVWGLPHPSLLHRDVTRLEIVAVGGATRGAAFAPEPPYELDLRVTNRGDVMWAAPQPLAPLFVDVDLVSADGTSFRSRARGVLPLALSAGATTTVQLVMPQAPAPGSYRATISSEGLAQVSAVADFRWSDQTH